MAENSDAGAWLSLYRHYKNGVLLDSGGLLDQPAIYITLMEFIELEGYKV